MPEVRGALAFQRPIEEVHIFPGDNLVGYREPNEPEMKLWTGLVRGTDPNDEALAASILKTAHLEDDNKLFIHGPDEHI